MDVDRAGLIAEREADQVVEALSKMRLHSLRVLGLRKNLQLGGSTVRTHAWRGEGDGDRKVI